MGLFIEARCEGREPVKLSLIPGQSAVIGRSPEADLRIAGDSFVSRRAAVVYLDSDRLSVKRVAGASNPIVFNGEEKDEFVVEAGEGFVIGKTRFFLLSEATFVKMQAETKIDPKLLRTISDNDMYAMGGHSERLRLLDLLELPEMLRSKSRAEFFVHLAALLRMATGGRWVSVTTEEGKLLALDMADMNVKQVQISRSLANVALKEAPRPTIYFWSNPEEDFRATIQEGTDWAICAAMKLPGESPLILYVAGQGGGDASASAHQENARFVGLVADMVGRSLAVQQLESWQGRLQQYFSGPVISKILKSSDPKELEPRLAQSTVMFFDLRGFSRRTEGQNEKILSYLGELRQVMTAMTRWVFEEQGVVLQYQGDGMLACWNVPIADPKHIDRACRAALKMCATLKELRGDWKCGIGLHTGEVVAGSIGSEQMFSYSVMGSVVNQASRVEGITKAVESPILVTREIADGVSPAVAVPLRIGKFRPVGMATALDLFELQPPQGDAKRMESFGKGLEALEAGDWEKAYEILDVLPAADRPARFLKSLAEAYRRHPPRDWKGVVELTEK